MLHPLAPTPSIYGHSTVHAEGKMGTSKEVLLGDVREVTRGVPRGITVTVDEEKCCFSIICVKRVIALQAESEQACAKWLQAFQWLKAQHAA